MTSLLAACVPLAAGASGSRRQSRMASALPARGDPSSVTGRPPRSVARPAQTAGFAAWQPPAGGEQMEHGINGLLPAHD